MMSHARVLDQRMSYQFCNFDDMMMTDNTADLFRWSETRLNIFKQTE